MTEKEKAAAGLQYNPNRDPALLAERTRSLDLCHEYNLLRPSQAAERYALLDQLLGSHGADLLIEQPFLCDYGYNIHVGKGFYANNNCNILDGARVTFGDHVFIGPYCVFTTAGHPFDADARSQGVEYAKPITVGNHVWIGAQVCVLPGITIGDNAVIGAGSVVTRDIPAGVLAVGNPCRVIREIAPKPRRVIL